MRMLFCSADRYPPFRVDVVVLFAKEITGRGHTIDWLLQSDDDCRTSYVAKWEGGDAWVGPADNGLSRIKRVRKHMQSICHDFCMLKMIRNNKYDVIQVKDKFIAALIGIVAAKINKSKFTYWLSYPFPEASIYEANSGTARYKWFYYLRGYVFKILLYRIIIPVSDHVFVQSDQMKADIVKEGMQGDKITPVPMGVSLSDFESVDIELGRDSSILENSMLYLGTMHRVRRVDFLIRVLEIVKRSIPDVKLYMVGGAENSEDMEWLRNEATRLNVADSVVFTGNLPQKQAMQYVREATVCLSPFYPTPILNSTSPTKLIEYMALGKPVVANDHPEQRRVIEESGAGICVSYDEDEFADAIVEMLGAPERLVEMGEKGRKYVIENRSYDKLAENVEDVLLKVCGHRANVNIINQ